MADLSGKLPLEGDVRALIKNHKVTVLLIDDQQIIGQAVYNMLKEHDDIDFHHIKDPTQGIEKAEELKPTVILLDLVMPEVDGMTLLRYFRANESTANIPIVVLSTKEDPKIKAEAFALGANDYMVKLPGKEEVEARVRYHSRGYISLLERNQAFLCLEENQKILLDELNKAADYVMSMLPEPLDGDISTAWVFIPSVQLGGDTFGYHWLDDDHFAIYLLDVCGHGVGAALLSVSVMNVIRAQSLPKRDFRCPEDVLAGLNDTFPMEKHNNMFFTMFYAVFNKNTRLLRYASGGHPPSLLYSEGSTEPMELDAKGLVVGGMPDMEYEGKEITLKAKDKIYVFSDGVFELFRPDGSVIDFPDFVVDLNALAADPSLPLDDIVRRARELQGRDVFDDDYSIVEFRF